MSNETEKLTINLGVVELAQIDILAERGIYSNRSDFIRTAIRKHLENYNDKIESALTPISKKKNLTKIIGIFTLSKKELEKLAKDGEMLNISVIGMLIINNDINAKLFEDTVETVFLRGKLIAPKEIKKIIDEMN